MMYTDYYTTLDGLGDIKISQPCAIIVEYYSGLLKSLQEYYITRNALCKHKWRSS